MDLCMHWHWRRESRHTVISQKERTRRECEKSMTLLSFLPLEAHSRAHWRLKGRRRSENSVRVHSDVYETRISFERKAFESMFRKSD